MNTLVKNVRFFNGTKEKSIITDIRIKDGKIFEIGPSLAAPDGDRIIDGTGKWMMPGFIDTHTHYDAEILLSPGLYESVRHGITTVVLGCCSISMVYNEPEDCADIFTRVESVPRNVVLPLLEEVKSWKTPEGYKNYLKDLPLGPNVSAFIGHSDIRIKVLGLENAVDKNYVPTEHEQKEMERHLEESLKAGFLGLSMMTTRWDKLDGTRFRSHPLPSTYARLKEFRGLNKVLRKWRRVLQGAPDIVTKYNMFFFLWESMGILKKNLKTTLITLADAKSNPILYRFVIVLTTFFNKILKADFRWQSLPCQFQVFADGMDLVIFEEFRSGEEALHFTSYAERRKLFANQEYRKRFKRDYETKFSPRVWHRDFHDAFILSCPDGSLIGKSFGEIALAQNTHAVDAFLDLIDKFGTELRWTTVIANHRKRVLEKIVSSETTIMSFSDAGAHLRNMAFYNFPLQLLKMVQDASKEGRSFMTLEEAVWKVTGQLGSWFNLDAGFLKMGKRADFVIIDPNGLGQDVLAITEAHFPEMNNMKRLVNRNDKAVLHVFINGREIFENGIFKNGYGTEKGFGQFLEAIEC
ncbi:MAG: N-acyl-D-amino-acid deacylase family protein [Bacteriovoracia bacterium]